MNIMYVCTGNICRSAMAEALLKKKVEDLGLKNINVYSCGVYAENGDTPTWEAKSVMFDEYGIDMSKHRATNMYNSKIEEMDLILCATISHKQAVVDVFPELKEKVFTMKEYVNYNREYHDKLNIKDPWGYDMETYRSCVAEIEECVNLLLDKLKMDNN